jgi:hypothetical protein
MSTSFLSDPDTALPLPEVGVWAKQHTPAAQTQATVAQAAGGTNVRNVCKAITASIACGATPQTPIQVRVLDGATVVWSAKLACPANDSRSIAIAGLNIVGSPNATMTIEFAAAGVANSEQAVSMSGFLSVQ